jgi:hypothetical protein
MKPPRSATRSVRMTCHYMKINEIRFLFAMNDFMNQEC